MIKNIFTHLWLPSVKWLHGSGAWSWTRVTSSRALQWWTIPLTRISCLMTPLMHSNTCLVYLNTESGCIVYDQLYRMEFGGTYRSWWSSSWYDSWSFCRSTSMRALREWNKYGREIERCLCLCPHSREGATILVLDSILVVLASRNRDLHGINIDNLQNWKDNLQHSDE